ncbi:hypothetical protein [Chitiniphilus shinanonensis]|uniref:hypothetical protein n=1 Tax=Chitiniphilus shinanonensis TaxID=553088 RepID=UPI003022EB04
MKHAPWLWLLLLPSPLLAQDDWGTLFTTPAERTRLDTQRSDPTPTPRISAVLWRDGPRTVWREEHPVTPAPPAVSR